MEVKLAQFGMGMQDGTVRHWFKAEGESIKRDEPLLEVEAAKTVVTIPAPCDGRLAKILVQVDENVPTQTVLAVLEPAGDNTAIEPSGSIGAQPSTAAPPERSAAPPHTAQLQVQVEPRARKLAQTLKVDLATVSGTGPNGRILEEDVHRAAVAPNLARYEDAPHSSTRRTIARRLTTSIQEIPHFYVAAQCEVDALLQARAHLNERGTAISLNDLIVRAAALALAATPDANVGWTDQSLRRYRSVDLGIAIATPHGVVAPVVRDADTKPLTTLAAELRDLSARARDARLQVAELEGGSSSVSNLGMYSVESFTAVINPPHASIFAVGAALPKAVVRGESVVIAKVMTCTIAIDHRVIDGAVAAQLLAAFKRYIELPDTLISAE